MSRKMHIEIWSDVMCPFCYIGKRKFETALSQFENKDKVHVIWKSFQLMPTLKTDTTIRVHELLAKAKGITLQQATDMNNRVSQMAKQVGLDFNFNAAVVANSFTAHRFLHFAKEQGKQEEAEEALFKAYFTNGKNIDDHKTLAELASDIGLDSELTLKVLQSGAFDEAVRTDIMEAQELGIQGVPFFVFDTKYGVSGAQDTSVFLQTIEKAFAEWKQNASAGLQEVASGESCDVHGDCK